VALLLLLGAAAHGRAALAGECDVPSEELVDQLINPNTAGTALQCLVQIYAYVDFSQPQFLKDDELDDLRGNGRSARERLLPLLDDAKTRCAAAKAAARFSLIESIPAVAHCDLPLAQKAMAYALVGPPAAEMAAQAYASLPHKTDRKTEGARLALLNAFAHIGSERIDALLKTVADDSRATDGARARARAARHALAKERGARTP
jgi:hypothetical protein